ncbi:hypothetical protein LGAA44_30049 [Leuconostoc gasicomitatum]|nr:hypothetical protein LGAA44_30049 [Leuconostoc gasicomitatum]
MVGFCSRGNNNVILSLSRIGGYEFIEISAFLIISQYVLIKRGRLGTLYFGIFVLTLAALIEALY